MKSRNPTGTVAAPMERFTAYLTSGFCVLGGFERTKPSARSCRFPAPEFYASARLDVPDRFFVDDVDVHPVAFFSHGLVPLKRLQGTFDAEGSPLCHRPNSVRAATRAPSKGPAFWTKSQKPVGCCSRSCGLGSGQAQGSQS